MKFESLDAVPVADLAGTPQDGHQRFCDEIAEGLHALAQPLSILQSALEMVIVEKGAGPNSQRYLELSATHLRETCETFAAVQNLLGAEIMDAKPVQVDFMELLRPLLEVHVAKFQALGISLIEPAYETRRSVFCDAARTEQAIGEVLDAMLSLSAAGDSVEITVRAIGDFVEFAVRNPLHRVKRLNARRRLGLSLARVNIRSQRGRYVETEDPFCLMMALPAYDPSVH